MGERRRRRPEPVDITAPVDMDTGPVRERATTARSEVECAVRDKQALTLPISVASYAREV